MKALLIGSLFVILIIIGSAVTFMVLDSANTIDAQVVTKTSEKKQESITAKTVDTSKTDTTTATSAKDALEDLKANGDISPTTTTDDSKTGFSLDYQIEQSQSNCEDLIAFKQEDFDDADEEYKDAKKAYEKAQARLNDLEDGDAIEEAQEDIKEKKEILDDAEAALFGTREELIKARTTCQS